MKATLIAVGSEMLTPFRLDTNSLLVTDRLNAIGYDIRLKTVVGDDLDELAAVFRATIGSVDLIVCTGGLGPTEDDLTRDALARVLELPLDLHEEILESISARFARRGLVMSAINRRQALVPRGATVLPNANGTAPGLWLEAKGTGIALLPGPPREMTPILEALIRDRLAAGRSGGLFRRTLKITGRTESDVDATAQPVYSRWVSQTVPISTTILAVLGQIELHLTASAASRADADLALDTAVAELQQVLGPSVYSIDGRGIEAVVGDLLRRAQWTISVAESCTGGLLASRLTDVPGSSDYFDRGVVCYSNQAKVALAGVPAAVIEAHGAVSEPVAEAMADGIRRAAATKVGVGITGIAGPGGGTDRKPVGTVAIAVTADQAGESDNRRTADRRVRTFQFFGAREQVKFQAAQAAMNMLRLILLERAAS
jgi:nicotinamide-nucleotide amidase